MNDPIWAALCPKPTKKSFLSTDIAPEKLIELAHNPLSAWADQKLALLHKDCPDSLTEEFLLHKEWYIRLTAALAKGKRKRYLKRLYTDVKSTVRAAAFKTAIVEELDDIQSICRRIEKDKWVHGYFYGDFWNLDLIARVASGSLDMKGWSDAADEIYAARKAESEARILEWDKQRHGIG